MKHILTGILLAAATARGGDLSFSDPAHVSPMPAGAVGQANRQPDLDVAPGFVKPPPGFGVVPFFWWLGDPLTKERLGWELEQMAGMGVAGYQINYAHSDKGGRSYGLTLPSQPALFSAEWWQLTGWFMQQAKQQGAGISLSDYTLGFGQGWLVDEILRENPDILGSELRLVTGPPPAEALVVTDVPGTDGRSQRVAVVAVKAPYSLDPMNPASGKLYADKFFGAFERRHPGEGGKGLNFFFSDELGFGVGGQLWTARFAQEFKQRKGYDLVPELPALFLDLGPRTPKIRLDYRDVMVSLTEEGFFQPVFDWHQRRGMTLGCDHGGRGRDVTEFGDYFRTQRWNQGPGSDQPGLGKDLIKAKVASSIAHLYQRPRVWLEGYYGSGWGTTSAGVVDATFADFLMGYNLLSFHGMYYATHGGWWEWAPPDNTFRMPYWKHMRGFMDCVQRLSYLLSQGHHRCDVAILYPVAPMEAGMGGNEAVKAAFETGSQIYGKGIDFDYMDFESLDRAQIVGPQLHVSGELYRVLVLPAMKAIRHSTLQKALAFRRAGGCVLAVGALPEASDRLGRNDPEVAAMVQELFPGGVTTDVAAQVPGRDYDGPGYILHRKLGPRDLYAIYNAPQGRECFFRATGKVELWDPWTGTTRPLAVSAQNAEGTRLKLPLTEKEIQLLVFSAGQPQVETLPQSDASRTSIALAGDWECALQPTCDNRFGDFRWPAFPGTLGAEIRKLKYAEETAANPGWQDPQLDDSKWGQVTCSYGPKFWQLGPLPDAAEVGALEAQLAGLKQIDPAVPVEIAGQQHRWKPYEFSWRFGMEQDTAHQGYHGLKEEVADEFIGLGAVRNGMPSARREKEPAGTRYYLWTTVRSEGVTQPRLLTGGLKPSAVWLNHVKAASVPESVALAPGANPVLLRYDRIGRGFFVFSTGKAPDPPSTAADTLGAKPPAGSPRPGAVASSPATDNGQPQFKPSQLAMSWLNQNGILKFDTRPGEPQPAGWYRFVSAPGLKAMTITARGRVQVWVDGNAVPASVRKAPRPGDRSEQALTYKVQMAKPAVAPVTVALRIEQARGSYGGATLPEPILLDCGAGRMALGDWSKLDGLASYSGGVWYRKTVSLARKPGAGRVLLDLGSVAASAEVRVNGKPAGVKVAPPWTFDISKLVRSGDNRVEVLVYNTLANHYLNVPTNYRGAPTSGLMGPVTLSYD